jgi:hypothetical protein
MRYLVIFFCAVLCAFALSMTQAEVPKLINYQGKLTTPQGALVDTTVSMQFSIYSDSTGGDMLWSETQASVKVDKGIFNVLLGSVDEIPESVFTGNIRYLGVKVGDDPEMTPRRAIVSVGYAYRSTDADTARFAFNARSADSTQFSLSAEHAITSDSATNADMVDGKHASELEGISPHQVYESEWFQQDPYPNCYEKTHNLGTKKLFFVVYHAWPDSTSNPTVIPGEATQGVGDEAVIGDITDTRFCICFTPGPIYVTDILYGTCNYEWRQGGWLKVIAVALP